MVEAFSKKIKLHKTKAERLGAVGRIYGENAVYTDVSTPEGRKRFDELSRLYFMYRCKSKVLSDPRSMALIVRC